MTPTGLKSSFISIKAIGWESFLQEETLTPLTIRLLEVILA